MRASPFEVAGYWIATALIFLLMIFAIVFYLADYALIAGFFERFGYPSYMIYPLAGMTLIAIVVIATNRYRNLRDMAYGAYFINMVMAVIAHLEAGDTPIHAYVGLWAIAVSYMLSNKVRGEPTRDLFILKASPTPPPTGTAHADAL